MALGKKTRTRLAKISKYLSKVAGMLDKIEREEEQKDSGFITNETKRVRLLENEMRKAMAVARVYVEKVHKETKRVLSRHVPSARRLTISTAKSLTKRMNQSTARGPSARDLESRGIVRAGKYGGKTDPAVVEAAREIITMDRALTPGQYLETKALMRSKAKKAKAKKKASRRRK